MDQGRVVSWSLPAQPRGGLNDGFGELLKFRPSSQLPKAWIWRCMWYNAHIFLAVLWLCRNWLPSPGVTCSASRRKAFLQEALQCLAPPHQVGCTLIVLAASVPLLVWLNLWPPIVFPFALFFFFYSSRQHHPTSRAAHASGSQHLHELLWPPCECGGRRAEGSTWMGKGGKGEGVTQVQC